MLNVTCLMLMFVGVATEASSEIAKYKRSDYITQSRWGTTRKMLLRVRTRPVTARGWVDAYTGRVLAQKDSQSVDVDHVVALAYAHKHGAASWDLPRKRDFANDTLNLLLTRDSVNTSKSDKAPAQWLPPQNKCVFARRWKAITLKYGIVPSSEDSAAVEAVSRRCK